MSINLSSSSGQAKRAAQLEQCRSLYLQDALANAISALDLAQVDSELQKFAPAEALRALAVRRLRGELLFAVPSVLAIKPNVLAYYRLVLGYSQKEFFQKCSLGRFQSMESSGKLSPKQANELPALCLAMNQRAAEMLMEIGLEKASTALLDDLSLLTLGPQLRGGTNNLIGQAAIRLIFELIQKIVQPAICEATETKLTLLNAAKRKVVINFSSDPDISISEEVGTSSTPRQNLVAIEIKGGQDASNIWNRFGEAEKSHQSAKAKGFTRFWTIYNVDNLDEIRAREKSPTTQRFFSLKDIISETSPAFQTFRDQLIQVVGLPK
jgi:hypothetical protein